MAENKSKKNYSEKGLGEQIFDIIQDSIDSMDFSGLNERIRETVEDTREEITRQFGHLQGGYYNSSSRSRTHTASSRSESSGQQTKRYRYREETAESGQPRSLPGTYSGPIQMALGGTGLAVFGGISLGFGLAGIGFALAGGVLTATTVIMESIFLPLSIFSAVFLGRGIFTRKRVKRLQDYISRWKGKSYIMLSDLQEQSGQSIKQIREDIHYLTDRKLLPGARMDQEQTCLLLTDEAIQQYEAAKESQRLREAEEQQKKLQEAELCKKKTEQWANATEEERELYAFVEEADSTLLKLEAYRKDISSEVMGEKLSRLELLLSRIFVCVKDHPEKLRLTSRLMDYYIPSVLRLLSVYEDMENQPIQGENIQKTLTEIESSMDTINEALETMFDELFQEEALDVSADIQVLRTMLTQEGWTKSPLQPSE